MPLCTRGQKINKKVIQIKELSFLPLNIIPELHERLNELIPRGKKYELYEIVFQWTIRLYDYHHIGNYQYNPIKFI